VVDHIAHVVDTVGEDHAAIGSDFDGAISPHPDLRGADRYPMLVEEMLRRGWSADRIQKILGENFLRCLGQLRPGP
jgi:membrane dipeptidase